jgi:hypothetical protein
MFFGRVRIDRGESRSNRAVGRAPVCAAARDRRRCGYRRTDNGAAAIATGLQSPWVGVVFRFRQCDKQNQDWREGPPLTVPCQSFDLPAGPSPSGKFKFERKKNTEFSGPPRSPHSEHWPV